MESSAMGRLVSVLISPVKTFRSIAERPTWGVAFLVLIVLPMVPALMALPKIDWEAVARAQFERMDQEVDAEQMEQSVSMMKTVGPISTYATPAILAIGFVLMAAVLWGAFNLVGGQLGFKAALATTLHGLMPTAVAALLSIPVVLSMESIGPDVLQSGSYLASSAAAFAPEEAHPALVALLASLDVFTIWTVGLLIVGFSAVAKVGRGTAIGTVLVAWGLWIAIKVGLASLGALFGGG